MIRDLFLAAALAASPAAVPAEAPKTPLDVLRAGFNAHAGTVRLLTLLSPTCPGCAKGYAHVRRIVEARPAGTVTVLSAWMQTRGWDNEAASRKQAEAWAAPGVTHVWDGEKQVSQVIAGVLGVKAPTSDVYLAYPPGVRWTEAAPPAPAYWLHQLPASTGAPADRMFAPEKLAEALAGMVPAGMPSSRPFSK